MKKMSKGKACSEIVAFKLRPLTLAKAKKAAKRKGLSLSAWIRQLVDLAA